MVALKRELLNWQDEGRVVRSTCRVCGHESDKKHLLSMWAPYKTSEQLKLLICDRCESGYIHDFVDADYDDFAATEDSLKFYLEQGAGVDILAKPGTLAKQHGVQNYLEIGCGYGFGVDFAKNALGLSAKGIDPAFHATRGRRDLELEITTDYLTHESGKENGLQDMIVAMEVIEHISDPTDFLKIIRNNLSKNGIVVMSTPNVAYLKNNDDPMLMAILQPGFHAVLFSAKALENKFREAGFKYVKVDGSQNSLFVVATVHGRKIDLDIGVEPDVFIAYTKKRMDLLQGNNSLWSAFAYRHFKALVNAGYYDDAFTVLPHLAEEYETRFEANINAPESISSRFEKEFVEKDGFYTQSAWAKVLPEHLCNLFYFIGVLVINTRGAVQAAPYFSASVELSKLKVAHFESLGLGDGETAALRTEALKLSARCDVEAKNAAS